MFQKGFNKFSHFKFNHFGLFKKLFDQKIAFQVRLSPFPLLGKFVLSKKNFNSQKYKFNVTSYSGFDGRHNKPCSRKILAF